MLTTPEVTKALQSPPQARTWLPDGTGGVPGLNLMLSPTGAARWVLRYQRPGTRSMASFGLGDARKLGLGGARKAAKKVRGQVANGEDPQGELVSSRKVERQRQEVLTVEGLFQQWTTSPESLLRTRVPPSACTG